MEAKDKTLSETYSLCKDAGLIINYDTARGGAFITAEQVERYLERLEIEKQMKEAVNECE